MRALVIDDSRAMRRIVTGILEGFGYEVQQAGHGREGLDVLDGGWLPDLVCVDWNMPVMDGLQFVSAVRSNPAWRQMTIMMVTLGICGYLSSSLVRRVGDWLMRWRGSMLKGMTR